MLVVYQHYYFQKIFSLATMQSIYTDLSSLVLVPAIVQTFLVFSSLLYTFCRRIRFKEKKEGKKGNSVNLIK